jgi:4-amino-4-deoxy-L-arabinose transferase-like glycosyltransferase
MLQKVNPIWIVLAAWFVLVACLLPVREVMRPDEARFTQQAQEMHDSRQWFMPTIGGVPNSEKPPALFWLINLAAVWQSHISETTARIPSALSSLLILFLVMRLGTRLWGSKELGLAAALVLLTSNGFFHRAQWVSCDMPLAAFAWISITLWREALFDDQESGQRHDWLDRLSPRTKIALGWLAASLGTMTKGLGLVWPVMWILSEAWSRRSWSPLRRLVQPSGIALFILPISFWLWRFSAAAGTDALYRIVWGETVIRYASAPNVIKPWYFYTYQLPADLLPWSVFLPLVAAYAWHLWRRRGSGSPDAVGGLACLGFVTLACLFFSMSSGKRDVYLLPAHPALALLMARMAISLGSRWDWARRPRAVTYLALAGFGMIPAILLPVALSTEKIPRLVEVASRVGTPIVVALSLGGLAIVAGSLIASRTLARGDSGLRPLSHAALGIGLFLFLSGLVGGMAANRHQGGESFGAKIQQVVPPEGRMAVERGKFELFLYYSTRKGTEWESPWQLEEELTSGRCEYALLSRERLEKLQGLAALSRLSPLLPGEVGGVEYVLLGPGPVATR